MRSDNVTKGVERAPNRSLFYALGYTKEELERPLIGVVCSYNEIVPGHMNLDKIAEAVKAGVRAAGGTPVEFQFRASGSRFLVKNFTSGYITCGILDAEVTIPANTSQVIATRLIPRTSDMTDKVTVTANETSSMGVEVQCLDY